ncbi:MAG TPA: hypothetical protein PKZ53_28220, partial [Acidobacteriota bacterium]|nr:hypothetical protein [Acidobacteriota bacterium]
RTRLRSITEEKSEVSDDEWLKAKTEFKNELAGFTLGWNSTCGPEARVQPFRRHFFCSFTCLLLVIS